MAQLVREICKTNKDGARATSVIEVALSTEIALRVFGPRVFDQLRKRWIEDDFEVVWVRTIGRQEAQALSQAEVLPEGFEFDLNRFEYALLTSL
jgi:hypothetical protein